MNYMKKTINRKPEIRTILGEKANKVLYYLDQKHPDFEKSSEVIANYVMQYPSDLPLLIEYRNLTKLKYNPDMPRVPYYGFRSFDTEARYLTQEDINFVEDHIVLQWDEARKNQYADRDSVLYEQDYTDDFIKCCKYPIIGNMSRNTFLQKLQQDLSRSNHGKPILNNKAFVQTMYARANNGQMYRFFEVIKINNTEEDSGTMKKVPTFDFTIELYVLPGRSGKKSKDNPEVVNSVLAPNINDATPIFRFDSKKSGHKNVLGHQHGAAVGGEAGSRFLYERVFKLDNDQEPHFHVFERKGQVIYSARPVSSNVVTLTQTINIGKKTFKDTSAFNGLVALMIDTPEKVEDLIALRDLFHCAHNQLDSKQRKGRQAAWLNTYDALRIALKYTDKVVNIQPERTLEVNRAQMLDEDYVDYEQMQQEWDLAHPSAKPADPQQEEIEEEPERE